MYVCETPASVMNSPADLGVTSDWISVSSQAWGLTSSHVSANSTNLPALSFP